MRTKDTDDPALPLSGVTVVDLGQIFQGPYAGLLMAKAGADVIKIEPPQGEPLRRRSIADPAAAFPLAMLNSKSERGRALLVAMVRRADVTRWCRPGRRRWASGRYSSWPGANAFRPHRCATWSR